MTTDGHGVILALTGFETVLSPSHCEVLARPQFHHV